MKDNVLSFTTSLDAKQLSCLYPDVAVFFIKSTTNHLYSLVLRQTEYPLDNNEIHQVFRSSHLLEVNFFFFLTLRESKVSKYKKSLLIMYFSWLGL